MISDEAKSKLRRLMELRVERDELKKAAEAAEKEYREAEAEIHADIIESGLERLPNVDLGEPWGKISFHAKETTYPKVVDEEAAVEYFQSTGALAQLSKPKLVKQRLGEIVRDAKEQGLDMPPGLSYYDRRYVQITRQKGSS